MFRVLRRLVSCQYINRVRTDMHEGDEFEDGYYSGER